MILRKVFLVSFLTLFFSCKNEKDIESLEDLQNHTTVIEIPNSDRLIIQAY